MKRLLTPALMALTVAAFAASPALAEKKNDWTLKFPANKAHFVKVQQDWARKDPNWNPTKEQLEARFDELDADKDGQLTEQEWAARDTKKAKKPKKEKAEKKEKKEKKQD